MASRPIDWSARSGFIDWSILRAEISSYLQSLLARCARRLGRNPRGLRAVSFRAFRIGRNRRDADHIILVRQRYCIRIASVLPEPRPIVTMVIDDIICRAECALCGDPLALADAGPSAQQQAAMLQVVFLDHMKRKHPHERA